MRPQVTLPCGWGQEVGPWGLVFLEPLQSKWRRWLCAWPIPRAHLTALPTLLITTGPHLSGNLPPWWLVQLSTFACLPWRNVYLSMQFICSSGEPTYELHKVVLIKLTFIKWTSNLKEFLHHICRLKITLQSSKGEQYASGRAVIPPRMSRTMMT